jgi:hypothetical protein
MPHAAQGANFGFGGLNQSDASLPLNHWWLQWILRRIMFLKYFFGLTPNIGWVAAKHKQVMWGVAQLWSLLNKGSV